VAVILVPTAGKVGSEAARLLAKRGVSVRVLAHHAAKAAALADAGVDVVEGDLDVPASIDAAMRGVLTVVLVSPAIPTQEFNVIESALRVGGVGSGEARHVVKITSKASPDSPIARRRGQAEIESRLIASGLRADAEQRPHAQFPHAGTRDCQLLQLRVAHRRRPSRHD
jgi:uncharacterized protein YbjT (DUF2867 family)